MSETLGCIRSRSQHHNQTDQPLGFSKTKGLPPAGHKSFSVKTRSIPGKSEQLVAIGSDYKFKSY